MSREGPGWLSCAATLLLLHTLGLDSRNVKQVVFGFIVALQVQPGTSRDRLVYHAIGVLQCAVFIAAVFLFCRSVLATKNTPGWTGQGKVLLFPCKTTHSRFFPKKHSFDYSYLVVGIPVGWEGISGGLVSSSSKKQSWFSSPKKGWYHVNSEDYLYRGDGHLSLRDKLDVYLKSQGVEPAHYPHAYLVTAARFLGYHFNPVSFWYLYSADMSLRCMVLEVNNTFDERRMYLLTPEELEVDELEGSRPDSVASVGSDGKPPMFKQQWPKDFHVSPFNSRKGQYSLLASDPLRALAEGQSPIDTTITLKSNKGHSKLVARIISEGHAADPSFMGLVQKAKFLLSWWWVGFITFPRIVREAGRLWFQKKLHVWYRPEPLKESIGRNADSAEQQLEIAFKKYLRYLVDQSQAAIAVHYIPSGIPDSGRELMLSPSAKSGPDNTEEVEFKVLTPAFYTRFISYAHDLEALFSELRESCTVWVSRPDLLPKLLFKKPAVTLEAQSPLDYVCFEAIRYLRRRPERIVRPLTSSHTPSPSSASATVVDIREFRISSMDAFILHQEDEQLRRQYRSLVLRLFIAERFAFGSLLLVDATLILLRTLLAWTLAFAWQGKWRVLGVSLAILFNGYV
ncbi:hypothetical protein M406DRAFT_267821 [Cryphonectria parasitica EP155]|uniref:Uncharacterized protein n=1 Tax=Cryphonectria parasitica (strain ATCC 38755 / EP155) TaxID=660469 RepID=A0A9P4XU70_CRYP1|nr:uncharacterized protein M406DRAFT_267821 [Cryphonectria parasitica EP155]KAF3761053.1 hypothetical protein M406DRAFT_267821 [Cryphonectria parasitica EP155]